MARRLCVKGLESSLSGFVQMPVSEETQETTFESDASMRPDCDSAFKKKCKW